MKLKLEDLTPPQQVALIDICRSRALYKFRAGYGERRVHAVETINALVRRGLCRVSGVLGCEGAALPTEAGWRLVKAALKHTNDEQLGSFPAALR